MNSHNRILEKIRQFRDERDWKQFHNPKDLATALAIEASELQELFLWKQGKEIDTIVSDKRERIEEETADIAIYLFEFADALGIDLYDSIEKKLAKNASKYPVEKSKGRSDKYTDLDT